MLHCGTVWDVLWMLYVHICCMVIARRPVLMEREKIFSSLINDGKDEHQPIRWRSRCKLNSFHCIFMDTRSECGLRALTVCFVGVYIHRGWTSEQWTICSLFSLKRCFGTFTVNIQTMWLFMARLPDPSMCSPLKTRRVLVSVGCRGQIVTVLECHYVHFMVEPNLGIYMLFEMFTPLILHG